jgi:hypothetical protein
VRGGGRTYELDKGLVVVGADAALGVDDAAERLAELDELLFRALPRKVPQVQHLGRRLRVAELLPPTASRRHSAGARIGGGGAGAGARTEKPKGRVSAFRAGAERVRVRRTEDELCVLCSPLHLLLSSLLHNPNHLGWVRGGIRSYKMVLARLVFWEIKSGFFVCSKLWGYWTLL